MTEIHIDTTKINECGNDLIGLTRELTEVINVMFDKINKINGDNDTWAGNSADQFKQLAKVDKRQYITFINNIYGFGKYLVDYSNSMNKILKGVKRK